MALRQRREFEHLRVAERGVVDGLDGEVALGHRARLVEGDGAHAAERLKIVRALYQYALAARPAEPGEKAERDAYDERAGAGDDEHRAGAEYPLAPDFGAAVSGQRRNERRQDGERERREADNGRVDLRKARYEALAPALAGGGVFHEVEYPARGRFAELRRRADAQHAREADRPAEDLVLRPDLAGPALARQGGDVERGGAVDHDPVERDLLARTDDNDAPDRDLRGVDAPFPVLRLEAGEVRAYVHQRGYVPPAFFDGEVLKKLAYLEQQHDRDALCVLPEDDRAYRGDGHEEVLVEDLAVYYPLGRLAEHVEARDQIRDEEERYERGLRQAQGDQPLAYQKERDPENGRYYYPCEQGLLFLVHVVLPRASSGPRKVYPRAEQNAILFG